MRVFFIIILFVAALRLDAGMVRVIAVENGRTLTVERNGTREQIRLAGVEVTDDASARELLRWTAGNAWVMLEASADGFLVYRSPDALFLNRELVLRGFARATQHGIEPDLRAPSRYLGTIDPPSTPQAKPKAAKPPKASEARPAKTSSDTGRRSSAPRSRKSRSRPGS